MVSVGQRGKVPVETVSRAREPSPRRWQAGEQLLRDLRVLQHHWPGVLYPRADVLVQATNQLTIELLYHDGVRAHDTVDIGAIECWTVEQGQLRKHPTMLFG